MNNESSSSTDGGARVGALARLAFPFTEEQLLMRDAVRTFARERLLPGAALRDRERCFPAELVQELASLGLLAMKVPVEHNGAGADNVACVLAMEAVSEACASTAVILASSHLATKILADHGSAAQKRRFLEPYAMGKLGLAAFCLTEPQAGSDAAALATTARDDGDAWILDGAKQWITSGAHAGIYVVFAKTDPDKDKHGISCFIVERGTKGLEVGREEPKMGLRSSGTVALHFDGCRIPKEHVIGDRGNGFAIAMSGLSAGRVGIAAQCIGIAEAAVRAGLEYASSRRAFGQVVSSFQMSQTALADSRVDVDAAWLLTLRAARLLDVDDDSGRRAALESSAAKLFASEACGRVVDRMLQLHGGYGYSEEYMIERLYRDARVTRIYEGTSEIQRLVIAREMLRTA
jgi:alkylation response protein AidB-like acyl-CoA dehydrogenase